MLAYNRSGFDPSRTGGSSMSYKQTLKRIFVIGLLSLVILFVTFGAVFAEGEEIQNTAVFTGAARLLTLGADGQLINRSILLAGASSDLSCIVISSQATNLVPGDEIARMRVFFSEGQTGDWQLLMSSQYDTYAQAISDDCQYVAFTRADPDQGGNVYLLERNSGEETLVSRALDNTGSGRISRVWMTPGAEYVFFSSTAQDIVTEDTNNSFADVYRFERSTGNIILVSLNNDDQQTNRDSTSVVSTSDGNMVFFTSEGTNFPNDEGNGQLDVFLRNVSAGTTVGLTSDLPNDYHYTLEDITPDGNTVVFSKFRPNSISTTAVYLHDVASGINTVVPADLRGGYITISADGSTLASILSLTFPYEPTYGTLVSL